MPPPGHVPRDLLSLEGPLGAAFAAEKPRRLNSSLLSGPIVAAAGCVEHDCCIAPLARPLLASLVEGYVRTANQWGKGSPMFGEARHVPVVRALLRLPAEDPQGAAALALGLSTRPAAQASVLRSIRTVATTDEPARATMRVIWPEIMESVLEPGPRTLDRDERLWDPVVEVLPEPEVPPGATDIDALLTAAAAGWPTLDETAPLIDRWLEIAPRSGAALSSLVGFVRTAPLDEQVGRGLVWIEIHVGGEWSADDRYPYMLFPWLDEVQEEVARRAGESRRLFLRVLDAMAAAGYSEAAKMQEREE